jgi:hypothetical protein
MTTSDHHHAYLARSVAALTPAGRARVDELLEQLAAIGVADEWLRRFALVRKAEADLGRADAPAGGEPTRMLGGHDLDGLVVGFRTIRDTEPLDDVADWANAVLALLKDEAAPGR